VVVVVQVNGKRRGQVEVARGAAQAAVEGAAMADPLVAQAVGGRPVQRAVYVKDRLLNLVV
jgi:leucyl-tRNA synthetase